MPRLAIAVTAMVAFGCDAGTGSDPAIESDAVTPAAVSTPADPADIPIPDGLRDEVVYGRLVSHGFSEAEANCLARSLTIESMVTVDPDELIAVYASCRVGLDRLIELGAIPAG